MRIILGVGNPGSRYQNNRHNVGFMFLDYMSKVFSMSFSASGFDFYSVSGTLAGSQFLLVKPTTYVNNSGIAALQAVSEFSVMKEDCLVVYDDLNLKVADYRIRASGGDGGHNGLKSVIYHLNSGSFPRLRIGIGSDFEKGSMADYVLSDFNEDENIKLEQTFKNCAVLMNEFISGGYKKMLDANSIISRSITNQNSANQEKKGN